MNIYVVIWQEVTQEDLEEAFKAFGQVTSVTIIKDKFTGNRGDSDLLKCLEG